MTARELFAAIVMHGIIVRAKQDDLPFDINPWTGADDETEMTGACDAAWLIADCLLQRGKR